jgi:hypothetical protein
MDTLRICAFQIYSFQSKKAVSWSICVYHLFKFGVYNYISILSVEAKSWPVLQLDKIYPRSLYSQNAIPRFINLALGIIQVETGPSMLCTLMWHDDCPLTWPLHVRPVF